MPIAEFLIIELDPATGGPRCQIWIEINCDLAHPGFPTTMMHTLCTPFHWQSFQVFLLARRDVFIEYLYLNRETLQFNELYVDRFIIEVVSQP